MLNMTIEQIPANTLADLAALLNRREVPDEIMATGPELIQYGQHLMLANYQMKPTSAAI